MKNIFAKFKDEKPTFKILEMKKRIYTNFRNFSLVISFSSFNPSNFCVNVLQKTKTKKTYVQIHFDGLKKCFAFPFFFFPSFSPFVPSPPLSQLPSLCHYFLYPTFTPFPFLPKKHKLIFIILCLRLCEAENYA